MVALSRRDTIRTLGGAALVSALAPLAAHGAPRHAEGSLSLVITYRVSPANRIAFHQEVTQDVAERLQRARAENRLADYRLLSSRYVESADWDVMALLSFADPAQHGKWQQIEDSTPAALGPRALGLVNAVETVPVDMIRNGGASAEAKAPPSVVLVIPYEYLIPAGEYVKYLDGYTVPQIEGWIREGVLTRYSIYLCRYPAGRPWNALLLLEYAGEEGLAKREATVAKVRGQLASVPEWKAWADNKSHIRNEGQVVVADDLTRSQAH